MNIKSLKYIIPFLTIAILFACSKLENDALNVDETSLPKATLNIKVINTDDNLPAAGVRVIISRQITAKGEFTHVDTIRTDNNGVINASLPFPNKFKVEVDTFYYHKAEQVLDFLSSSGANVTLHTSPKFGMVPLNISVTDNANVAMPAFPLKVETKLPNAIDFISTGGLEQTDANGKLVVSLPYPNLARVSVADTMKYFPDTVSVTLENAKPVALALKSDLKPVNVPLVVTVLDKDNNAPLAGINVDVLHKLTGEADFRNISLTGTSGSDGKITLNAPFEGEVKIMTSDDVYFFPASVITRLAYANNRNVTLLSKKLVPMAPVEITVFDQSNNQILPGVSVKLSSKVDAETTFTVDTVAVTDELGKLNVKARFSGEMRIEVLDDIYFTDKVITMPNVGSTAKQVSLPLTLKAAAYPEPILTSLMVSSLSLNNGIILNAPSDVVMDKRGNTYVCDKGNHRIIRISRNGNTTVLAGIGTPGTVDGAGSTASFSTPWGLALNDAGTELYVSDNAAHKIRKITINLTNMTGVVSTVAGSGNGGYGDNSGTAATFWGPSGLALDEVSGTLYIACNQQTARIRKIALSTLQASTITTTNGLLGCSSVALSADRATLYVGGPGNASSTSQLVKVNTSTNARTGLRATITTNFNDPLGLYASPAGKLLMANDQAHMISQMATEVGASGTGAGSSTFSFVAGSTTFTPTSTGGPSGTSGNVDGTAANARFNRPVAIRYNPFGGNFVIVDQANNKIRIMKSSTIN